MKVIGKIYTDFKEKFGVPRQSGLIKELTGYIIFEPEYRSPDAVRGLEEYEYIWLLWKFDVLQKDSFNATVKPPRLGGNEKMGVFATRSPFRPNNIGLSSVKLEGIEYDKNKGPILKVSGIDMVDKTCIYDIKPYLPYADSHPQAKGGFATKVYDYKLQVVFPKELLDIFDEKKQRALVKVLEQDPRPGYHNDPDHIYGMAFGGFDIRFTVSDNVLIVKEVI